MGMLDIVDERGKVTGQDTRGNIHAKGLLHREIRVWFYTPNRKIIFSIAQKIKTPFPAYSTLLLADM